jgi:hypothetical protein
MLQGLVARDVRFVVVGGVAAAAHGSTRVTNDLDLCYEATDENLRRLAGLLASWEAYPRGWEPGLPFIMDVRTLRTTPLMTLDTTQGAIDLLDRIRGVGGYAEAVSESEEVEAFELAFPVLGLPALIRAKRAAGRPKDLDQLPELEALRALARKSDAR